ncbi:di-trans,poly-cis-decaprenylcistransferase [Candidatus Woesebacteria bacterium]|nr:di-trans,poly-cis-decaprenylcistransferase [Candidatus Woesebacteria bacterium]QQG47454.1 MAG: di-trans,poly-cis-decaprenylcistransferase [Candidatus Woesebacteria bacterium]
MLKGDLTLPRGTKVPDHIAIILDGNRRWARARGLHTLKGHHKGFEAGKSIAKAARELGIHTLTVWGFSTENWDRTDDEISYLMKLFSRFVKDVMKEAHQNQIRFVHLGRKDRLPKALVSEIQKAEEETRHYTKHVLNVALDYGGRDEIMRATKKIIRDGISEDQIDEKLFSSYLDTGDQLYPYVDLFIRPSGEQRTSGLLPWQMTYAEIYWEEDHLPAMTPEHLKRAILDYSRRRRRFGGNDNMFHFRFKPEVVAGFEVNWWRLSKIPKGTKFVDYAMKHLKEQWGLSKNLATDAAKLMIEAISQGEQSKWDKASKRLVKFYKLIRDEVKLAFEPKIAASLEIHLLRKKVDVTTDFSEETESLTRKFVSEVYRISDFQASKAAHLRALAVHERALAERGYGEEHWKKAEEALERYYRALKDRVA